MTLLALQARRPRLSGAGSRSRCTQRHPTRPSSLPRWWLHREPRSHGAPPALTHKLTPAPLAPSGSRVQEAAWPPRWSRTLPGGESVGGYSWEEDRALGTEKTPRVCEFCLLVLRPRCWSGAADVFHRGRAGEVSGVLGGKGHSGLSQQPSSALAAGHTEANTLCVLRQLRLWKRGQRADLVPGRSRPWALAGMVSGKRKYSRNALVLLGTYPRGPGEGSPMSLRVLWSYRMGSVVPLIFQMRRPEHGGAKQPSGRWPAGSSGPGASCCPQSLGYMTSRNICGSTFSNCYTHFRTLKSA